VTNSKGKRRRPGSKNLSAVLKCDDALFVDFIAKCLIWDPERRLKPFNAMHHPWIVAGKKAKAANASPLSMGIQTAPRTARSSKEPSIDMTPTKKKSSDNLSNGRYAVQPPSAVPSSGLGSKVSSSRTTPQGMLKARISKPSPLTPKASATTYPRSADLAPLSSATSRFREKQPLDAPPIKVRQLTGKTVRPAV
jgi:dual specificity tyrosine-phosphorylation-regulated kinase 2/3/4